MNYGCLSTLLLAASLMTAAALERFQPTISAAFESNQGQFDYPATHFIASQGWAFDCSSITRSPNPLTGAPAPRLTLSAAKPTCVSALAFPAEGLSHYYRGPARDQWFESIPRYNILEYQSVAPGLYWHYQTRDTYVEWRWDLAPAAQPSTYRLRFENSAPLRIDSDGSLITDLAVFPHPIALQARRSFPARWRIGADPNEAYLEVTGTSSATQVQIYLQLPIQPLSIPFTQAIRDAAGNWLTTFPDAGLFAAAKFNPTGELIALTYLPGGSSVSMLRTDPDGNFYLAGATYSSDFPTSENAVLPQPAGGHSAFVTKLYGPNAALIYSTYVGITSEDTLISFDVDSGGRPLLLLSPPLSSDSRQTLLRLNESFSDYEVRLIRLRQAAAVRYAPGGSIWLLSTPNFLDHYSPDGQYLESQPLSRELTVKSFAVAPDNSLWLSATQTGGPTALARLANGRLDIRPGFPLGSLYADPQGNVTLLTPAPGFSPVFSLSPGPQTELPPITPDAILPEPCGALDYYARFSPDFTLTFATFLPPDARFGTPADPPYPSLIGFSAPLNLWTLDPSAPNRPILACIAQTGSEASTLLAPATLVTLRGRGIGPATPMDWQLDENNRIATTLGGIRVTFAGRPAPILRAEPDRIDAIIPAATPARQTIPVVLLRDGQPTDTQTCTLYPISLALLRAENEDGSLNSAENPAALGASVRFLVSGAGPTNPPTVDGQIGFPILPIPRAQPELISTTAKLQLLRYQQAPEWPAGVMELTVRYDAPPPFSSPPQFTAAVFIMVSGLFTSFPIHLKIP
ncbi:MAG: hypothetical protein HY821_19115 [Acidobacteria bacterium]|nr:hypothetical protein [Acidobacteriota bacterium]